MAIVVAHLDAGLRRGDTSMPEEINRIVTDALADVLWTPSPDADENLRREGVASEKIERIGNIMIDALEMQRECIEANGTREALGLRRDGECAAVMLHRPSNGDDPGKVGTLAEQLLASLELMLLMFAMHPRRQTKLQAFEPFGGLQAHGSIHLIEPLGYV